MTDPYIYSEQKSQAGVGTGLEIGGTEPTHIRVELLGPADNPSVVIGEQVIHFGNALNTDKTLILDSETQSATIDGISVMQYITGQIPMVNPGHVDVSVSWGTPTFYWKERDVI
jgi:hypothetical protein